MRSQPEQNFSINREQAYIEELKQEIFLFFTFLRKYSSTIFNKVRKFNLRNVTKKL